MKTAIATFVKTPGVSPLKTRLGKTIGQDRAEDFYRFSVRQTEKLLKSFSQELPEVKAFWSVAESEAHGHKMWQGLPVVSQGEGGLGDRLHHVYSSLIEEFDAVFLFGADSPHIKSGVLMEAYHALESHPFVIGPTEDGGFYLFGGTQPISEKTWTSVSYSQASTMSELMKSLNQETALLSPEFDIDTEEELRRLCELDSRYQKFLS